MSNKTENDELGVQRKIHSGLVKQLCAPTLNMNKRLNNKMPEKKKNRKMIYELSQLLRWRHPVHYTPKSFSWSSHSSFTKVTKAVSILTLQNKEWKTNLHSTRRLYRFSLMLHAWFSRVVTRVTDRLMIYTQLRQRRWMSHSDRINEATHVFCVLQQLKLGELA